MRHKNSETGQWNGYGFNIQKLLGTKCFLAAYFIIFFLLISCDSKKRAIYFEPDLVIIDTVLLNEAVCSCFMENLLKDVNLKECVFSFNADFTFLGITDSTNNMSLSSNENIELKYIDKIVFKTKIIDCIRSQIESFNETAYLVFTRSPLDEKGVRLAFMALVRNVTLDKLSGAGLLVSVEKVAKPLEKRRISIAKVTFNGEERTFSSSLLYESHTDTLQRLVLKTVLEDIKSTDFFKLYSIKEVVFPIIFFEENQLETWDDFMERKLRD